MFGTPLTVPQTRIVTRRLHDIALHCTRYILNTTVFHPLPKCRHDAIPGMARLTDFDWVFDREQEAEIKELFEARGWDYVHKMSLPFLNFDETFLARNSFVQPFFATDNTTVASAEPETERQGDRRKCRC